MRIHQDPLYIGQICTQKCLEANTSQVFGNCGSLSPPPIAKSNDRIFLIFFVSLSTPTGLLAQQAWFFLTPFWCHWGTKSRTNGLQQNSSTFNPFVCFSDRTISSFNFFVCFSDRTIIRGWRAGVGALYMVRWSTEGQANAAQVCFLIYNSYSSFKFWWGGIVRKMYDNSWEWDN